MSSSLPTPHSMDDEGNQTQGESATSEKGMLKALARSFEDMSSEKGNRGHRIPTGKESY